MTECNLIAESEEEMFSYKNQSEIDQEKVQKCQEYLGALDEERKKIQVFERELPLCLHLVSQAIERCRLQMSEAIADSFDGQSDHCCADQTSSECPVLEEFIPMKSTSSANEDFAEEKQEKRELSLANTSMFTSSKDWLASAQLSIQPQDPPVNGDMLSKKMLGVEEKVNEKKTSMSSSVDTDGDGGGDEDKGRSNKKERRCWSPELHRRFLHALQQLGGAHVATPKQIRETMKVNGLTNDEIKSHLQKYRLHTRRSNPTTYNGSQYTPQLVVVGRIWMPPLDYTANLASKSTLANDMKNNAKTVYPR